LNQIPKQNNKEEEEEEEDKEDMCMGVCIIYYTIY
jgi:hypothetical protein